MKGQLFKVVVQKNGEPDESFVCRSFSAEGGALFMSRIDGKETMILPLIKFEKARAYLLEGDERAQAIERHNAMFPEDEV